MSLLVTGARGKTGRHVIAALKARENCPPIRGFGRSAYDTSGIEYVAGDLECPEDRARAVAGVDCVIHYAPPFHPRETAFGTGMIDAAKAAGVKHFIYISVIHPQIEDLLNHRAKLAVEAYLINAGIDWTILRPQHYMQNIDVARVVGTGALTVPYPVTTVLGHVDMADVAEAAAKVALEPGHFRATYDLAADAQLSPTDICNSISAESGKMVNAVEIAPAEVLEMARHFLPAGAYTEEALYRLFGYYARRGIHGNSNVLTWLLGRTPTSFEAYVRRMLAPL